MCCDLAITILESNSWTTVGCSCKVEVAFATVTPSVQGGPHLLVFLGVILATWTPSNFLAHVDQQLNSAHHLAKVQALGCALPGTSTSRNLAEGMS